LIGYPASSLKCSRIILKINFSLAWARGDAGPRNFKSKECATLFMDYLKRISHYAPTATSILPKETARPQDKILWLCDLSRQAAAWTSEDIAKEIKRLELAGTKELTVAIGGADGFGDRIKKDLKPDRLWSFGPVTLPHELAAVVAAEQIYRAYTINRGHPYHGGH
jgi:23S rRNA (pseudouridine1915-N3)-methyltransferase